MASEPSSPSSFNSSTNAGVYLRTLLDELIFNLHHALEENGFGEIKPSHGWVFQYIGDEGSRITELATQAKMTKQSMSALVYQLEEWGFLERRPDERDKRAVLFILTDKGRQVRALGRSINQEFEDIWRKKLGVRDYDKFKDYLRLLCM